MINSLQILMIPANATKSNLDGILYKYPGLAKTIYLPLERLIQYLFG